MIPALRRQRQLDLSEFEPNLVYKAHSSTTRTVTQNNPVSKQTNKQKTGRNMCVCECMCLYLYVYVCVKKTYMCAFVFVLEIFGGFFVS